MINLPPYSEDSFKYHKSVVSNKYSRKNDPSYKERLENMFPAIELLFKQYGDHIKKNDLKSLTPEKLNAQEKEDLLSLYNFRSKILQDLNIQITTDENGRKFNTCQMCTIEPVGNLDHILPKEEFPEFVVNPINLFPCCFKCNGKKSAHWLLNNERLFLNLYFDILSTHQYLKVGFDTYPIPYFSILKDGFSDELYKLFESHYERLDLFNRFKENSAEVIDPIITDAKRIVPILGIEEYKKTIAQSTSDMKLKYGVNHWKSLLKLELVYHEDFEALLAKEAVIY